MIEKVWAEVSCLVPAAMVDSLSEFLVELSGTGVSTENLSVDTFSVETLEDSPLKSVKAYLPADSELAAKITNISTFVAKAGPAFPGFVFHPPEISYVREEDWANNWKEHFKPTRIGARLVIKPTWEDYQAEKGDIIIELDPGMAFGTGTHATTRLCLESLERVFSGQPPFDTLTATPPADVLDVGTGSGVLAIAAAKFGAPHVLGIDIDAGAVEVAQTNLVQNSVETAVRVTTEPLENVPGEYHVVLANILAEELVRLGGALLSKVRKGGVLILSGILAEKEEFVTAGFRHLPLILVEILREAEWSCIIYRREC